MNQGIKAVIFDWAGTTVDYGCFAPIRAFIDGFRSIGIDITNEMAREPMGLSKIDHVRTIAAMLPEPLSEEEILRAYGVFEETLFANIERHCDIKDHVLTTVTALRERGIKIGSTTGYTSAMMKYVLRERGQDLPDFASPPTWFPPAPLSVHDPGESSPLRHHRPREAVKVSDTVPILRRQSADCWTVGRYGFVGLGLTRNKFPPVGGRLKAQSIRRATFFRPERTMNDDMNELLDVIADINQRLVPNRPGQGYHSLRSFSELKRTIKKFKCLGDNSFVILFRRSRDR